MMAWKQKKRLNGIQLVAAADVELVHFCGKI
jgi:hypothetical protein